MEDLTIGNGDYVGRNERRNVTRLSFDNRQRSQRTGFPFHFTFGESFNVFGVNTRSTLQQTRVEVEYVARECFTSWRTTEQQGDLTVSNSLFRQVIVNDQRIFTAVWKYSPIAQPAYGARYCSAADSDAVATTTMVLASAPCSSSLRTTLEMVDAFWPIAT